MTMIPITVHGSWRGVESVVVVDIGEPSFCDFGKEGRDEENVTGPAKMKRRCKFSGGRRSETMRVAKELSWWMQRRSGERNVVRRRIPIV